ncbi:NUDIX hydrolase [Butyrivibrio sp. VCB2006]|uniref:NUDIX hydrolase n=1 Tax=Butyrivibrio sp. VCB2006 TaxID=1280679 RepID=UPI000415DF24|nr:8-oxo-dGTP diphosphatase [Butyrivibrio sp. VCB2006]
MARRDGITTLCYLERDNKYLMLHRVSKKNDINKDKWIGVGGHLEDDESPEECIKREIFEETGYDIPLDALEFRAVITFVSAKGDYELMNLFTAKAPDSEPKECDEGKLEWVTKDKVFELNLWEGDKIFLKRLSESRKFFSMKLVYDIEDKLVEAVIDGKTLNFNTL